MPIREQITLNAYAKINLSIDVLGKLPTGYHEVEMIMQQIDLKDQVAVEIAEDGQGEGGIGAAGPGGTGSLEGEGFGGCVIRLSSNRSWLPADSTNIAYKAAALMVKRYRPDFKGVIQIDLKKGIPVAAGLAGGSADGAAVLHGLAKLWKLPLSLEALMELGLSLGADVPFCIMGQQAVEAISKAGAGTCALAQGIGEKLTVLPPLDAWILLSKPKAGASTAAVYGGLNLSAMEGQPDTPLLIAGLKENNLFKVTSAMGNVLAGVTARLVPEVEATIAAMEMCDGAAKVLMSGSGPAVYGIFTNRRKAEAALRKMRAVNQETYLVRTLT